MTFNKKVVPGLLITKFSCRKISRKFEAKKNQAATNAHHTIRGYTIIVIIVIIISIIIREHLTCDFSKVGLVRTFDMSMIVRIMYEYYYINLNSNCLTSAALFFLMSS